MTDEARDGSAPRRAAILDAAMRVFLRYGFKKTSMDDLARAAGLSRQGLYIHFSTKEELFQATVLHLVELLRGKARAALAAEGTPIDDRLLGAFEAMHGFMLDQSLSEHLEELLETAKTLAGSAAEEALERSFVDEVARALRAASVTAGWKELGLSARELADSLYSASYGIKHRVSSLAEYRERMRVAVRLITRGAR